MTTTRLDGTTRRRFLAGAAGAGVAAVAPAAAQSGFDGWFDGVGNYDGVVDRRGESAVTVEVGAEGNGATYAFAPAAVRVDPGTTVTFDWVSDTHNVEVASRPSAATWQGHAAIENTGFAFEHAFETEGVYTYFCAPHRAMGMRGAVVVGDASVGGASAGDRGGASAGGNASAGDRGGASTGGSGALARYATLGFAGVLAAALVALPIADARGG